MQKTTHCFLYMGILYEDCSFYVDNDVEKVQKKNTDWSSIFYSGHIPLTFLKKSALSIFFAGLY